MTSRGETCADSIDVPYASIPFCTTASTEAGAQNYHVPCIGGPFNTAHDAVYCLSVPSGAKRSCHSVFVWQRLWSGDQYGAIVTRMPVARSWAAVDNACADDGCVTFDAAPDSFYYIIVDGGQGLNNDGIYHLNIREGTDCADYPATQIHSLVSAGISNRKTTATAATTFPSCFAETKYRARR